MAHSNETANYHLSQFVGTDIPNPLVDYNGDMVKIDTAIKGVADASAGYASDIADIEIQNGSETLTTTAQTLSGAVNELDSEVGDINTRLTTAEGKITADEGTLATAVGNISTLAGKVSGLETKVGTAVLTTTASDCSGAINELDSDIGTISGKVTALETQAGSEVLVTTAQTLSGAINELAGGTGAISASNVTYDGTTSGLTADDVQEAIDEVVGMIPTSLDADDITYDNTTSGLVATDVQGAIDELAQGGADVNTFGTAFTITETTFATAYVLPSDGYAMAGATGCTVRIYGANATADSDPHISITSPADTAVATFVRKGMKVYRSTGSSGATFVPFS